MSQQSAVASTFTLLRLPTGRRAVVFRAVAEVAAELGDAPLAEQARAGLLAEEEVLRVQAEWWQRRLRAELGGTDPELGRLDAEVDASNRDIFADLERASRHPNPVVAAAADRLRRLAWLGSLVRHTNSNYAEQAAINQNTLAVLRDPAAADDVEKLHLRPWVDRFAAQHEAFVAALNSRTTPRAAWQAVVDARAEGHHRYLILVAAIISRHGGGDPAAFNRLFSPVAQQEAAVRAWRKGRRTDIPDVDPITGEEVGPELTEADGAEAPAPAPEGGPDAG
jgi:hypothetical protein